MGQFILQKHSERKLQWLQEKVQFSECSEVRLLVRVCIGLYMVTVRHIKSRYKTAGINVSVNLTLVQ